MSFADGMTLLCGLLGAFFFLGGTVGLLRFPDLFSRLHALTKADNLGMGLVILGLLFQAESLAAGAKLVVIWGIALWAASTNCYAIGRYALTQLKREKPYGKDAGDA